MPELHHDAFLKRAIVGYSFDPTRDGDTDGIQKWANGPASVNGKFENSSSPSRDKHHVHREGTAGKRATTTRALKESSKYFGVRFRPDLSKWVAEIRVAEWKTVDKKVWLGTFETEQAAARAVDAARKLLKCRKKNRPANFPCPQLDAYPEQIPPSLKLNHLQNHSMFKEVTCFVKRKAQEYAASFDNSTPNNINPAPLCDVHSDDADALNLQEDVVPVPDSSQEAFLSNERWMFDEYGAVGGSEFSCLEEPSCRVGWECYAPDQPAFNTDISDMISGDKMGSSPFSKLLKPPEMDSNMDWMLHMDWTLTEVF